MLLIIALLVSLTEGNRERIIATAAHIRDLSWSEKYVESEKDFIEIEEVDKMSKESFLKNIGYIESLWNRAELIYDSSEGSINLYEIEAIWKVVEALIDLMAERLCDFGGDIGFFIYELDFGRNYKEGCIKTRNGTIVDFSTAEKLYDYLVKQMAENFKLHKPPAS